MFATTKSRIVFLFGSILIIVLIAGIICDNIYSKKINEILYNNDKLNKVEFTLVVGQIRDSAKTSKIEDSVNLDIIGRLIKKDSLILMSNPKPYSDIIQITIFKSGQKIHLDACNNEHFGWVLNVGSDWFKNDSLFHFLLNKLTQVNFHSIPK
jgi:hypothetical protein